MVPISDDLSLKLAAYNLTAYLQFTPVADWDIEKIQAALSAIARGRQQEIETP